MAARLKNSQHEAFLNEYKGNIFEFLVAKLISQHFEIEAPFVLSLSDHYLKELGLYEDRLRELDRSLFVEISSMAQKTSISLIKVLQIKLMNRIIIVGKEDGRSKSKRWHEGDVVLFSGKKTYPLSLKLYRNSSFVNTKSGGIKSFLSKYFNQHKSSFEDQKVLTSISEFEFFQMGQKLYDVAGLGEFLGFSEKWFDQGYSDRPGELPQEMREILYEYYHKLILTIYQYFLSYKKENKEFFLKSMAPLIGFTSDEVVQVICSHDKSYKKIKTDIYKIEDVIEGIEDLDLIAVKDKISSFEISSKRFQLQIRIKPMNKYTVAGVKINCSVKYK